MRQSNIVHKCLLNTESGRSGKGDDRHIATRNGRLT